MTRAQFSLVVGADEKWVENTVRTLGVDLQYTDGAARWLRLVRTFTRGLGVSVSRAVELAAHAQTADRWERASCLAVGHDPSVQVQFDAARFESGYIAALSAARELGGARQVGRPRAVAELAAGGPHAALQAAERFGADLSQLRADRSKSPAERLARLEREREHEISARLRVSFASILQGLTQAQVDFVVVGGVAAVAHGSSRVTNDLDICYADTAANLDALAALLAAWEAYPRGIERGLPFFMDIQQLVVQPTMALTTREGLLNVLAAVRGIGGYAEVRALSIEVEGLGVRFRLLDLPALIASKRAANRPKDRVQLPELEAMLALRALGDAGSV